MRSFNLKFVLLSFLCIISSYPILAQSKFIVTNNYESLLHRAKQANKPLFLVVHQRDEYFSPFKRDISQRIQDTLDKQFVCGIVQLDHDDFNHPLQKALYLSTPIYLFADKDGYPLLRHEKKLDGDSELLHLIDSANTIAKGETMGKLVAQYQKGIRNRSVLTKLLNQYQALEQYTDQQVLNDYIAQLSIQELNNFEIVLFLLSCGPIYNSKNYILARTNSKMVDSLYSALPSGIRKKINNRIIRRTFREALDKKDFSLAQDVGYFAEKTWGTNYLRGAMTRNHYAMEYKRLMRDTLAYSQMAKHFYNDYFYRVDPDSLSKIDFAHDRQIKFSRRQLILDSAQYAVFQQYVNKGRQFYKQEQARNLSYGARQMLAFEKSNLEVLYDAIRWQQKAIVQQPGVMRYHHTLAQLLYRVGFYAQAESEQQQAVILSKKDKQRHKEMLFVLKQIQSKRL